MIPPSTDNNPNLVEINLDSLEANLDILSMKLNEHVEIMPVVKSDGYGHGLVDVSQRLAGQKGVWGLGISSIQEAHELRRAGIKTRLFLLSGCFHGDEKDAVRLDTTVGAVSVKMLDRLQKAAAILDRPLAVHIKVDTGMARYGVKPEELPVIAVRRNNWPNLIFQGIYTHMPVADEKDNRFNIRQIESFAYLLEQIRSTGWEPEYVHMANSAATINFPESHFNLVRPGIAIYGALPGNIPEHIIDLKPVMSFSSRIACLRDIPAGTALGYGHTARVTKKSMVAVVPAGYDDGYMRSISCKGAVLVKGLRCDILGRICMKAFMVDVTGVPCPSEGDRVIMLGNSGDAAIKAGELAKWAGTISYELMCLIGSRNRRILRESQQPYPVDAHGHAAHVRPHG